MNSELFSFSGRIGRKSFASWALVGAAMFVAFCLGLVLLTPPMGVPSSGSDALDRLPSRATVEMMLGILTLGPGVSICVRRLKDIGLQPWLWIGALSVFQVVDAGFSTGLISMINGDLPPIGLIADCVALVFLLLMPGSSRAVTLAAKGESGREPEWVKRATATALRESRNRSRRAVNSAQPAAAVGPAPNAVPVFGRRR